MTPFGRENDQIERVRNLDLQPVLTTAARGALPSTEGMSAQPIRSASSTSPVTRLLRKRRRTSKR